MHNVLIMLWSFFSVLGVGQSGFGETKKIKGMFGDVKIAVRDCDTLAIIRAIKSPAFPENSPLSIKKDGKPQQGPQ